MESCTGETCAVNLIEMYWEAYALYNAVVAVGDRNYELLEEAGIDPEEEGAAGKGDVIKKKIRAHFKQIYNIETGYIKSECLYEEWTTGSGRKIIRLAFNLYTGWTPTIRTFPDEQEKLEDVVV